MTAEQDIRDLPDTYERSLNTRDATLATACYTRDGVFMPTATGDALHTRTRGPSRRSG